MRSGSVLVAMSVCLWIGCLDTAADTPAPTAGNTAAFAAWAAGTGSDKPALAQPSALRAVSAQAGSGGAQAGSKASQPTAAGARPEAPIVRASRDGGAAEAPAAEQPAPALSVPERAGDLLITEIMADPETLSDTQGEWIELFNATDSTLELRDCELDDGDKSLHPLAPPLRVEAGAYFTLARVPEPGFTPDLIVPLSLTNSADSVAIVCHGSEIDRVRYDKSAEFAVNAGVSLALDPDQRDVLRNDEASAWCEGQQAYNTDLGSPGRANPSCHADSESEAEEPADPDEALQRDAGAASAHDASTEGAHDAGSAAAPDAGVVDTHDAGSVVDAGY